MAKQTDLTKIKLLVLDVDGVLTDGSIVVNSDGSETKSFNVLDGHGITIWKRAGLEVAFLSGRSSSPTRHRAAELGVNHCLEDCHDKLDAFGELIERAGVSPEQVAYVGDDLPDLPVINRVGFGVAVANAVDEVKQRADFVTQCRGGEGAVREVIEYVLKKTGRWQTVVERYTLQ